MFIISPLTCGSLSLFTNELGALYNAFYSGNDNPLPVKTLHYADYAAWQHNWLQGEVLADKLQHWKDYLAGIPQLHSLPTDKPRPAIQTYNGTIVSSTIDAQLTTKIRALCEQQDVTLFMLLQTAFSLMLSRYSNETDIVCGSPIAGRAQSRNP